jgi:hypothetical protein
MAKSRSIKGAKRKFGGCAWKAVKLTSGDLPAVPEPGLGLSRDRPINGQKSAEGIVVVQAAKARTEGQGKY